MFIRSSKLSIIDIFQTSNLIELAQKLESTSQGVTQTLQPYSLAQEKLASEQRAHSDLDIAELRERAAAVCQIKPSQISDILPATHMQQGLLAMTSQHEGDYVRRDVLMLMDNIRVDTFNPNNMSILARHNNTD